MRIKLFFILFCCFIRPAWSLVTIDHWQLPQGTRVYYVHSSALPMVDIRVTFDAGSARDGYQFGLAALTAAMLDNGAGHYSADDIARRFDALGAQFGSSVSMDMASVSLRTLTKKPLFDEALDTLRTVLSEPSFNQADFQREKSRTLAALKHRQESPGAQASLAFYKALYHDHPYAHPGSGLIETVSGFTAKDVRKFYQQYYVAKNAIVVIVGDLSRQQAEKTAASLISGLPVGNRPEPVPEVTPPVKGSFQHIDFPSSQTHVLAGFPVMKRKDQDYFPLYVGNFILGGSGLVSELAEQVREKRGLAYSVYSYFSPLDRAGPFTLGLQTRNNQTNKALAVMKKTLTDFINHGPTEQQLIAAKKNITGGFVLRFDTNGKLANYINMIGFYQQPLDYLSLFPEKVKAVSMDAIKEAFQRRINPDLLQIVTVGGK